MTTRQTPAVEERLAALRKARPLRTRLDKLRASGALTAASDRDYERDDQGRFGSGSGGGGAEPAVDAPASAPSFPAGYEPGSQGVVDAAVKGAMDRFNQPVTSEFGLDEIKPGGWGYQAGYGGIYRQVSEPDENGVARVVDIGRYGDGTHKDAVDTTYDYYKPGDLSADTPPREGRTTYSASSAGAADSVLAANEYIKTGKLPDNAERYV